MVSLATMPADVGLPAQISERGVNMVMAKANHKGKAEEIKTKAPRVDVGQLIVTDAWEKVFSTGSRGFFGRAQDATGRRYQITAVEVGSKPKN
jgi:hypothetical protein